MNTSFDVLSKFWIKASLSSILKQETKAEYLQIAENFSIQKTVVKSNLPPLAAS